ncbi:MAG: TRAP transporter TatT component family protein [Pseudomonadota bacterium]
MTTVSRWVRRAPLIGLIAFLGGCASLIDQAVVDFSNDLETAVLNYDEPLMIERGLPAFLLILEARLQNNPENAQTLMSLAQLTSAYAGLFIDRPDTARSLNQRALDQARKAACLESELLCDIRSRPFLEFEQDLQGLPKDALDAAYILGTTWAGWIASASDDFSALADLPKVEALLEWVTEQSPEHDDGGVWLYLAVLNSQRPPAAGGRPALALQQYERALEISRDKNLLVKVFMADQYARLLFDRDLFVELLEDVVAADPDQPDYVLANHIAQARARDLLEQTATIFD